MESDIFVLNLSSTSVDVILGEVIDALGPLEENHVLVKTDPLLDLSVTCDSELIRRVLINLGENALKHLGLKGGLVRFSAREEDNGICFRVEDDGPGIPAEALETIFDKFKKVDTTLRDSCGLGLTFCKMTVEAHGGTIGVESHLGAGSVFQFWLPQA